jgi:alcohol dehydrogenase (NADP+)
MNLPAIGFGTSPYRSDGRRIELEQPVRFALEAGYRLFDLAEMYGNERALGRALRSAAAPPRKELHLIGKVWRTNFRPDHLKRACEESLHRLGIDAFDIYLLHAPHALRHVAPLEDPEAIGWPEFERRAAPLIADDVPLAETWEAMRSLLSAGLTARIGTSNFTPQEIEALGEPCPYANQVASWPLHTATRQWHARHNVTVLGYSPLKREIVEAPLIRAIASAHARTPAQVTLRWLIQHDIRPVTSSSNPDHIRENLGALEFELDAREVSAISAIR